ncbi:Phytochrome, two-component sensor histidine kinase [Caenispirillum salinarum AK4]|uniref:histidine kinase n=1 Tax=Caenispirillum salinarum AK4 TaxID=1238182 RepID=K9HHP4_9PROT|nr:HWE histidine kinase domain-containing protein [Caenispirillum salinarum]EKV28126.1 Phytochrome, two-component sensor histidine kinase [Caenispirillum salinarum AK4]
MGARIRAYDWAATQLGPPEDWPQVLQTLTALMLASSQPMFLVWGPERTTLYNDAYGEILAAKHPALGQPFNEIWHEIWDSDLKPIVARAYAGEALHMDDIQLVMVRRGYPEEAHFSFSYTPVCDEDGAVLGFFCPCLETTEQVLEQRRARLRADLTERLRMPGDPSDLARDAAALLARHLGAEQAAFAEVDPSGGYAAIAPHRDDGRHRLKDFGPDFIADLEAGRSIAINDVMDDPRTATPHAAKTFVHAGIRAILYIPHVRHGRLVAVLAVHAAAPRHWPAADIDLSEEVAERVSVAMDRVRAEAALRASEGRLRKVLEIETVGIVFFDLVGGIHDANDTFLSLIGYSRAELQAGLIRYESLTPPHWHWRDAQTVADLKAHGAAGPFEKEYTRKDGSVVWTLCASKMLEDGTAAEFVIDITERKRSEQHQAMLMAELDHRVKNVLAVVQSIVRQSLRGADLGGSDAADRLIGRISALAESHTLLAASRWEGARFRDLVDNALAPYRDGGASRIRAGGPDLRVTPKAAQTLALALHELVTNAVKYGALSVAEGSVAVDWRFEGAADDRRLVFVWAEQGGPALPGPPRRKGFGSRLIERTLTFELDGTVTLDFAAGGLRAVFDLPLRALEVVEKRSTSDPRRAIAPSAGEAATLSGRRVLLVEDQHLVAEEMAEALVSVGCSVAGPASTLDRALRAAEAEDLDAAVLDINLSGDLVWPAARLLRDRGIPFVFATGYSETIDVPPELADVPRIEKPAQPQHLVAVVAGLIAGN